MKRQTARLSDAACLAARRKWNQSEDEVQRISNCIEELNRQFTQIFAGTQSIANIRAIHNLIDCFNEERRRAAVAAQAARQTFQAAASKCIQIHREIDTLDRILADRQEQIHKQLNRRETRQLDDLILQKRSQARFVQPDIGAETETVYLGRETDGKVTEQ